MIFSFRCRFLKVFISHFILIKTKPKCVFKKGKYKGNRFYPTVPLQLIDEICNITVSRDTPPSARLCIEDNSEINVQNSMAILETLLSETASCNFCGGRITLEKDTGV